MTVLWLGWAGASCCPWLSSLLGTIVLAVAWEDVAEQKHFPGENNPSWGCVPGPVTLLGPCASSQGLCPDGCQHPLVQCGLGSSSGPWGCLWGWGYKAVSGRGVLAPQSGSLGQASSLPGVQQEDFHCC